MDEFKVDTVSLLLRQNCWELNNILFAMYDYISMKHPYGEFWCHYTNDYNVLFEEKFSAGIIQMSGLLRALMDTNQLEVKQVIVGRLVTNGVEKELNFREACNKIIHASNLEIEYENSTLHPLDNGKNGYSNYEMKKFKNPIIVTKGVYQGKNWSSKLNFNRFVEAIFSTF